MPRQQKREERKGRQDVVRQLRFHDREDDDDHCDARDQIKIEGIAIPPEAPREPRNFYRPWRESDKDGEEIKRQEEERGENRTSAVPLHRAERTPDDVAAKTDL